MTGKLFRQTPGGTFSEILRPLSKRPTPFGALDDRFTLEIMHAAHEASGSGRSVALRYPAPRPESFGEA